MCLGIEDLIPLPETPDVFRERVEMEDGIELCLLVLSLPRFELRLEKSFASTDMVLEWTDEDVRSDGALLSFGGTGGPGCGGDSVSRIGGGRASATGFSPTREATSLLETILLGRGALKS